MMKILALALVLVSNLAQAHILETAKPVSEMELAEQRAKVLMQFASNEEKPGFQRKLIYCWGTAMGNVVLKTAGGHCTVDGKKFGMAMDGFGTTGGQAFRTTVLVAEIAPGGSLNGIYRGLEFGLAFTILGAHVGYFPKQSPADGSRIYLIGYQAGLIGDLTRTSFEITGAD